MIAAIITAKRDSKRLPGKNLREIEGKPLLVHSILYARRATKVDRIYVTTDSDEIASVAGEYGAEVIRRGADLAGDASTAAVIDHAVKNIGRSEIDYLVCLQPDHPCRKKELDAILGYAIGNGFDSVFSVNRNGIRNGSVRVLSARALGQDHSLLSYSVMDDCVNIHTESDMAMAAHEMSPFSHEIEVGKGKKVGKGHPTFIIAEAACNHMCDIDMARKLVDEAVNVGADAIKFQTYKAKNLVRKEAKLYWEGKETSQIEYYGQLDRFGAAEYEELFRYAGSKGIIAFSTPFDLDSATMLNDLRMPLFKIASCDLPDIRLLRHVAGFGKPVILSTGGSTPEEIDRAVATFLEIGNHKLILMACMLSYPTPDEDANLLQIRSLQERFPSLIVGLSDHTEPDVHMVIPALAAAVGARAIEKHFTLDRKMVGSGHFFSVDPEDLRTMVSNIRLAETVLGNPELGVVAKEKAARENARRSIVAEVLIRQGENISSDQIGMKRPGDGLPGWMIDQVIGRRAKVDIGVDEALSLDMLE